MPEVQVAFNDADAYESYMGQWSRAIGENFIAWLAPPAEARWLDVGCGTGAFCDLIAARCKPKSISGVDPAAAQIAFARSKFPHSDLRVADAMALPFGEGEFDIVASALVLHFIPDRAKGLSEMKRVTRRGGIVAGYTWERASTENGAPYAPMMRGLRAIGAEVMSSPTVPEANLDGLQAALATARFENIEVTKVEATQTFRDFDEYWRIQTLTLSPAGKSVAKLNDKERNRLRDTLRTTLPIAADGSISYVARAVAFQARKAN